MMDATDVTQQGSSYEYTTRNHWKRVRSSKYHLVNRQAQAQAAVGDERRIKNHISHSENKIKDVRHRMAPPIATESGGRVKGKQGIFRIIEERKKKDN